MSEEILIRYFNLQGLVQTTRYILEDANLKYKEEVITLEEWHGGLKQRYVEQQIARFEVLPVVSYRGIHISQSEAIARYFAKITGIQGKTDLEQLNCDMIVAGTADWRKALGTLFFSKDFDADLPLFIAKTLPHWLSLFEKLLKQVEGGDYYFCGKELLFCDFFVFDLLQWSLRVHEDILTEYPKLRAFHERVSTRPRIAAYLASGRIPAKLTTVLVFEWAGYDFNRVSTDVRPPLSDNLVLKKLDKLLL